MEKKKKRKKKQDLPNAWKTKDLSKGKFFLSGVLISS